MCFSVYTVALFLCEATGIQSQSATLVTYLIESLFKGIISKHMD